MIALVVCNDQPAHGVVVRINLEPTLTATFDDVGTSIAAQILMAPIEKLPFELLQTTLLFFRPQSHNKVELHRVLQLSGVCQSWRRVIISTPDFWSSPIIDFPQRHDAADEPSTFDILLQRTGRSQIDVEFNIGIIDDGTNCSHLLASIAKNAPFSRWRSLVVKTQEQTGTADFNLKELFQCGEFQNLLELTTWGPPPASLMRVIDRTAAALTRFEMEFVSGKNNNLSIDYGMPLFDRITRLSMRSYGFLDLRNREYDLPTNITHLTSLYIHQILQTLPYVTHLETGILPISPSLPIVFPALKSLRAIIEGIPTQQILLHKLQELVVDIRFSENIIHSLLAPELQTLRICGHNMVFPVAMRYLNDALYDGRYQLSPKNLSLREIDPDVVVTCLRVSRQTQDLTIIQNFRDIQGEYEWRVLVDALVAKNGGRGDGWIYCPDLITLRISMSWPRPEKDIWLDYTQEIARARVGGPMQSISLDWSCGAEAIIRVESTAPGKMVSA